MADENQMCHYWKMIFRLCGGLQHTYPSSTVVIGSRHHTHFKIQFRVASVGEGVPETDGSTEVSESYSAQPVYRPPTQISLSQSQYFTENGS